MAIDDLLKQIVAVAKDDVLRTALPALKDFLTSIATDHSAINFALQLSKFNVTVIAALPSLEKDVISRLAGMVDAALQDLLNQPPKV